MPGILRQNAGHSILTGWIAIQIALIGYHHWVQAVCLALGFVTLAMGAIFRFSSNGQDQRNARDQAWRCKFGNQGRDETIPIL